MGAAICKQLMAMDSQISSMKWQQKFLLLHCKKCVEYDWYRHFVKLADSAFIVVCRQCQQTDLSWLALLARWWQARELCCCCWRHIISLSPTHCGGLFLLTTSIVLLEQSEYYSCEYCFLLCYRYYVLLACDILGG